MTKLKYRLKEGEEIMNIPTNKELEGYDVIVAVVMKKPITEKQLVDKVKEVKKPKITKPRKVKK